MSYKQIAHSNEVSLMIWFSAPSLMFTLNSVLFHAYFWFFSIDSIIPLNFSQLKVIWVLLVWVYVKWKEFDLEFRFLNRYPHLFFDFLKFLPLFSLNIICLYDTRMLMLFEDRFSFRWFFILLWYDNRFLVSKCIFFLFEHRWLIKDS